MREWGMVTCCRERHGGEQAGALGGRMAEAWGAQRCARRGAGLWWAAGGGGWLLQAQVSPYMSCTWWWWGCSDWRHSAVPYLGKQDPLLPCVKESTCGW
jgi:hypothetical protein